MKIFAISLGCAKNSIDTELILGSLANEPCRAHLVASHDDADVILINTCGFLESAVQESIETILEIAQHKRPDQILAVTGCMVERYGAELERELPEVDIFHGTARPELISDRIKEKLYESGAEADASGQDPEVCTLSQGVMACGRLVTTPPWRAFVKIAEGCSNRCTYCLIPALRGSNRCRPVDEIIKEINLLSASGVREITLLAQDLTSYMDGTTDLTGLCRAIIHNTRIPWLRLLYLHPAGITDALLRFMAENSDRLCPYLDIPVQHAATAVLKRMGRGYDSALLHELFTRVRAVLPEAALRTTVMVGFPGETDDHFQELLEFIKKWRFMHLGCFIYSDEEECAACRLDHKVKTEISEQRRSIVMETQAEISAGINRSLVGKTMKVLAEGISEETDLLLQARTMFQAPEVDGITYITDGTARPGDICHVKITDSHIYDLVGKII